MREALRCAALSHIALVDPISGTAAQFCNLLWIQRRLLISCAFRRAPHRNHLSGVMPFFQMGEPIVGHELDPESRQDVKERRLLVVAFGIGGVTRKPVSGTTFFGVRLDAREELAADHLRVWL